jgi:hypothetical protein
MKVTLRASTIEDFQGISGIPPFLSLFFSAHNGGSADICR